MRVVARKVLAEAGRDCVQFCATELLVGGVFADGGLHQRRPGQEDVRLSFTRTT